MNTLQNCVKNFLSDKTGSIMVYAGLAAIPVIGFTGVALDSARGYMVRSHLVESLDAAALSAGRALTQDQVQADVTRFFNLNFRDGYMGAVVTGPTATYNQANSTIDVIATATIKTSFMQLFGRHTITVSSSTTITRDVRGMELSLIMDNTGSMRHNNKLNTMKSAARDLIDILYGTNQTLDDFWISVVPYSASVNVGNNHFNWLTGFNPNAYFPTVWKGCVEARNTPNDQNDLTPIQAQFNPYYYAPHFDNQWPSVREGFAWGAWQRGPNLSCGQAILPLTDDRSVIEDTIDDMVYWLGGGTLGNLGLVWGWRTLSPNWRGLWNNSDVSLPLDYNTPQIDKVAIMLTDGVNQFVSNSIGGSDYTAYGRLDEGRLGTTNQSVATAEINARFASTCEAMKQEGIILYTITFQLNDTTTQNLYRNCATSNEHYFNSPTNDQLRQAFIQIGTALSNLRISQ